VTSAVTGHGLYCFALENPTNDSAHYDSRGAGAGQPALLVAVMP